MCRLTVGNPAEIVLDWPAWLDLHGRAEDVDRPLEIDIAAARWWEYPRLAISHPDPTVRLAGAISILSFALGVVSVILGGWSLWITIAPARPPSAPHFSLSTSQFAVPIP